ncbi:DUF2194 domain-containing protein [Paenibacillus bovis]|uniref:DUF2194 domain-containing protein n=1 Tax=Paenibacillus bovis TaxID=1616788 RepID=A0A172ZBA1_9BACL|nr:DUF2194 domain-containing protein [Paenibacillus bovis]ANF94921.1 hypothetical protein AR543_01980 [Paenibacillus bovis]
MKFSFKLTTQVYAMLAFMLVMALIIQASRSDAILHMKGNQNHIQDISGIKQTNALTPEQTTALQGERQLLLLFNPKDSASVKIKNNAEHMLNYMKIRFDAIDVSAMPTDITAYDGVILTLSSLSQLPSTGWIDSYVQNGGSLLFTSMPQIDQALYQNYRKMGIIELGGYLTSTGLEMKSNVLLHNKDAKYSPELIQNGSIRVRLGSDSIVHATSDENVPLLWETPYGKGKFVVFNGSMFQEKTSRGVLSGAISLMLPDTIYPVLNVELMYIDDFPAPIPAGTNDKVYQEYHRNTSRFYKDIWWPDMLKIAAEHNLKYTGVVIQTYNNQVKPPFGAPTDADGLNLTLFGRELIKQGGEIGVHGYNHQSLTTNERIAGSFGYNAWPDRKSMSESITSVLNFIHQSFVNYKVMTYVPPSNALDADGRAALKSSWPDLKSISSVYSEDPENRSYVQEFEIADDGIAELPRISSGFMKDEFNDWATANAVTSLGVFSHFVHPDDILDPDRSHSYNWEQMRDMFEKYISQSVQQYSWLRPMTASQAAVELQKYQISEPHFVHKDNEIDGYINHFPEGSLFYVLRTDRPITTQENCKVTRIDSGSYLVEVTQDQFRIGLGDKKQ